MQICPTFCKFCDFILFYFYFFFAEKKPASAQSSEDPH